MYPIDVVIRDRLASPAFAGMASDCELPVNTLLRSTRSRLLRPHEVDAFVSLTPLANADAQTQLRNAYHIGDLEMLYIPEELTPRLCNDCSGQETCPLFTNRPETERRELFPQYLMRPEVIMAAIVSRCIVPLVYLPNYCSAAPRDLSVNAKIEGVEAPGFYSQLNYQLADSEDENVQMQMREEVSQVYEQGQIVLSEPLAACQSCNLNCPLR